MKWLSIKNILIAFVCLVPLAIPFLMASSTEFPSWAFPVDPPPPPGARPAPPKDDGTMLHVPDSDAAYTRTQIRELHEWAGMQPNKRRLEKSCLVALYGATAEDLRRGETQHVARERCAVAYNAMTLGAR